MINRELPVESTLKSIGKNFCFIRGTVAAEKMDDGRTGTRQSDMYRGMINSAK